MHTVACRDIHRHTDPQIVIYTDKRNPLLLRSSVQPASTYKNGLSTHSVPAILQAEYRLYNAPNNRRETCHSCESVQSTDPQQTSSDQTLLTGKPNPYVPKERQKTTRGRR